jgi:beta-phosphoglucomutase-like phosphatase (HAD superfamily)
LSSFFSIILDESCVSHGKPNPEIYLKAAAALQLPPERCIVFEDSLSGVAAAQAAGCKVVGVLTTHSADELAHSDMTIEDFTNLQPEKIYRQINLL